MNTLQKSPAHDVVSYEGENCTDLGNAKRLVSRHGKDMRFCKQWNTWLYFDGKKWTKDNTFGIERMAKNTVLALAEGAMKIQDDDKRRKVIQHALRSENAQRLHAMISLACSEKDIAILPEAFDTHPWLLNCDNGTINLKDCSHTKQNPDDLITMITPVEYDKNAKCPQWEKFLSEIMGGNEELVSFLQRAVGYCLVGDTRERALFILHGSGANGKSTFITIIRELMGDYAANTRTETLMIKKGEAIPNDIARLCGKRFVCVVETESGQRLAESLIKQLTGSDAVTARFLHGEYFDFIPEFKIFLAANHLPRIRGNDKAIWDRIRLIPFNVTFSEDKQDKELSGKLRAELPGILAWAVRGNAMWQQEGLKAPAEVSLATSGYRENQDILAGFIQEKCVTGKGRSVTVKDCYREYMEWCKDNDEQFAGKSTFNARLEDRGFKKRHGAHNVVVWDGISLLRDEDDEEADAIQQEFPLNDKEE